MNKKMTYVDAINVAIEMMTDDEVREKLVALKASLEKRNSTDRKPSAKQTANEDIKTKIVESMVVNTKYTITDMIKQFDFLSDFTNQKVSALVRQLVDENVVVKNTEKGKSYFTLAE